MIQIDLGFSRNVVESMSHINSRFIFREKNRDLLIRAMRTCFVRESGPRRAAGRRRRLQEPDRTVKRCGCAGEVKKNEAKTAENIAALKRVSPSFDKRRARFPLSTGWFRAATHGHSYVVPTPTCGCGRMVLAVVAFVAAVSNPIHW